MFRPISREKVLGREGGGYLLNQNQKLAQNLGWHIYLFRNTWLTVWFWTFKLQIHICFIHACNLFLNIQIADTYMIYPCMQFIFEHSNCRYIYVLSMHAMYFWTFKLQIHICFIHACNVFLNEFNDYEFFISSENFLEIVLILFLLVFLILSILFDFDETKHKTYY